MMPSNALIVGGVRVLLPESLIAMGASCLNYLDDGEPHLAAGKRPGSPELFVLHETCGNSATGCKDTLIKNGNGVELILGKDGTISNHSDLLFEFCWHAKQGSKPGIGMEVVNPYRPEIARTPYGPTVPAEWWTWVPKGKEKLYVAPLPLQMAIAMELVPWLCGIVGVPVVYPTADLNRKKPRIMGWKKPPLGWWARPKPGIVAHQDFSGHGDGRYMLEKMMKP